MKKTILGLIPLCLIGAVIAFTSMKRAHPVAAPAIIEAGAEEVADRDFNNFLKQFPKAGLPYNISAEYLKEYLMAAIQLEESTGVAEQEAQRKSRVRLNDPRRFLPGSRYSMFSRIPVFLEPVARMETKKYHAIVYSESQGFGWAYKSYRIAVFTKAGQLISENVVAHTGSTELVSVAVDAQLKAVVQTYQIKWKNDYYEYGTEGNEISGLTLDSAETMDLTKEDEDLREYKPLNKEELEEESIGALNE